MDESLLIGRVPSHAAASNVQTAGTGVPQDVRDPILKLSSKNPWASPFVAPAAHTPLALIAFNGTTGGGPALSTSPTSPIIALVATMPVGHRVPRLAACREGVRSRGPLELPEDVSEPAHGGRVGDHEGDGHIEGICFLYFQTRRVPRSDRPSTRPTSGRAPPGAWTTSPLLSAEPTSPPA